MTDFLQNCIDGVMFGSGYALLALGFTLLFGVMKRLNLSFGPSIMLGAYAGTWVYLNFSQNVVLVLLATVITTVAVGIYVERLCFWAVRRDATIASMVSSFAIWMQLEEVAMHLLPERTYPFPTFFTSTVIDIGPFFVRSEHISMFLLTLMLLALLHLFLFRTRPGLALRAVADNPLASAYMGINSSSILFLAFAVVSAIGGLAGFLILSADSQVTPYFGLWATFKGLIAMMLGGMGSLPGAILGGLLLGVVEANAFWYGGPVIRDISAYLLLFVMLIVRPGGLVGQRIVARQQAAYERV
ncbi:MAG: branched-chain amino acid ABC transporter permease [Arenicellales bacterium]|jgi:branched-chain amino acid transport system permease protein|nr:branched-chain amino acid ABC transporter permease [Arenicellales bacterium]